MQPPRTEWPAAGAVANLAIRLLLTFLFLLQPSGAEACFVCFGGKDTEWPQAFNLGVLLLLALPPAIIGFAGFTIYRAIKRQEATRAAENR